MDDQGSVVDPVSAGGGAATDVDDPRAPRPGGVPPAPAPATPGDAERADETEPPDHVLLVRCRRGDAGAWSLLVRRYERLVFSVALRNGLDREDAADVTQATFTSLLESIDDVVRSERLASWLMTVARRTAWRHRRGAERERERTGLLEMPDAGAVDPLEDVERAELVHEALSRLGGPCRELLVALYLDPAEPTYAEVAARTGVAVGTIGPARARCLRRLRQVMVESMDDVA